MTRWFQLALALSLCLVTARAFAFSTPEAYSETPGTGGGGGRWFSGSPADGYGCDVCHSSAKGQRRFPLYVTGLASTGFAPASMREVVLSWPEFAQRWRELRPNPMQPTAAGAPSPAESLVAELVAESGKGSGIVEIDAKNASAAELCELTRPNLKPKLAANLYQVRRGVDPILVVPDANGILHCEAHQLGQRCLIALTSCGAQQVRFRWTSPPQSEGPIWFSAGFVASEAISGTPENDSVVEVTLPMVEVSAASATYQSALRNACGVALVGVRDENPASAIAVSGLFALVLVWRSRGKRRRQESR